MRTLILAGLALSAALIIPQRLEAAEFEWCRLARAEGGRECIFHTFEQCAMSTERLNGGGCVENPAFRGGALPAQRARTIHQRHKPHQGDANR